MIPAVLLAGARAFLPRLLPNLARAATSKTAMVAGTAATMAMGGSDADAGDLKSGTGLKDWAYDTASHWAADKFAPDGAGGVTKGALAQAVKYGSKMAMNGGKFDARDATLDTLAEVASRQFFPGSGAVMHATIKQGIKWVGEKGLDMVMSSPEYTAKAREIGQKIGGEKGETFVANALNKDPNAGVVDVPQKLSAIAKGFNETHPPAPRNDRKIALE